MKNIIILGGGYAGVSTAHRIIKHAGKNRPFKITLVSPNTHFYWNMASTRALVPGQLDDSKVFLPIAAGFEQYPASQFEYVLGAAESLDVDAKTLQARIRKGDAPFKGLGSTEATKNALHDIQAQITKANTIVVAGAGATGVEFAAELGSEYKETKEIILIASGARVLAESPAGVSSTATNGLYDLKVNIKLSTKVTSASTLSDGRTELTLSDGGKLTTDLYIPTFGLAPNSSYVPAKFFNAEGFVSVDEYFTVKGAKDVYAIGDVCDVEPLQFVYTDIQSTFLAKNFNLILSNKSLRRYKEFPVRIMGVSIGKNLSAGHFGIVRFPKFVGVKIRKNLFLEKFEGTVNGQVGDSMF